MYCIFLSGTVKLVLDHNPCHAELTVFAQVDIQKQEVHYFALYFVSI